MNFFILCGGGGNRMFPLSREKYPKQFLKLIDSSEINEVRTMLQNTVLRIYNLIENLENYKCKLFIICNKDHSYIVEQQILELNINLNVKIITEPKGRDSAAAICIATLLNDENLSEVKFNQSTIGITTKKALESACSKIVTRMIKKQIFTH